MEQIMTNTFKNLDRKPYCLIAAGGGAKDVTMPDGTVTSCAQVKRELGYPQLFAWNLEGKELLEWVEYLNEHPECPCKLVVDSGAYTAWSKGKLFDMDEYINFLNSNRVIDTAFWVAEADVIPGRMGVEPTPEENAAAPEQSWQNYLYMIERVKYPKKVVPIFHQGEDFKHLKRMLSFTFPDGDHIPYIGISPSNDSSMPDKKKWYEKVWGIIKGSEHPDVLTHNFGMTSISLMEQYPSYSSDSTSWIRFGAFGHIMVVKDGKVVTIYVGDRKPDDPKHISNQSPAMIEAVEELCKEIGHGITLQDLKNEEGFGLKMVFNLYALHKWASNFEFEGTDLFKESLWD